MIKSKYISDILELLIDEDVEASLIKQQLPFLTEASLNYTPSGLFVKFSRLDSTEKFEQYESISVVNGVKINSSEHQLEAEATLFLKHGIIDYLEIWCYLGNYPKHELKRYTLTQTWSDSAGKTISTE